MSLFFGVVNIVFGVIFCLIGFKHYNPFKGKNIPEKEAEWYKKYGTFFKIVGIVLFIGGIINLVG
jgi:hypothetical protein